LAAIVLVAGGCGDAGEPVCRVSGQVSHQGTPLQNAVITFFPQSGRPFGGPLDDQGNFSVELPPGDYDVSINAPTALPEGWQEGDPLPPERPRIPPHYSQRQRSGLNASIPPDSRRLELDFSLE
jgi:hypothetical protein